MNDPTRWAEARSDVDPVVRQLLRYAHDLSPSPAEAHSVLRRVQHGMSRRQNRLAGLRQVLGRARRRIGTLGMAFALTGGFASVALAGYTVSRAVVASWAPQRSAVKHRSSAPPHASHDARRARGAERSGSLAEPVVNPTANASQPGPEAAQPTIEPGLAASARAATSLAPRRSAAARPATSDLDDDAELLKTIRRAVSSDPLRALSSIREHATRFPRSALIEERDALRIEALYLVGRETEARQALAAFEKTFPVSLYRRRLKSLDKR